MSALTDTEVDRIETDLAADRPVGMARTWKLLDTIHAHQATIIGAESATKQAIRERDTLAQALYDAWLVLGFDGDGDTTPAAWIAGSGFPNFAHEVLHDITEHRKDDDVNARPAGEADRG